MVIYEGAGKSWPTRNFHPHGGFSNGRFRNWVFPRTNIDLPVASSDLVFENCSFVEATLSVRGGDRVTQTGGMHRFMECDFNKSTLYVAGMGHMADSCIFHTNPGMGVVVGIPPHQWGNSNEYGVNGLVLVRNIYRGLCTSGADQGAAYVGADWTSDVTSVDETFLNIGSVAIYLDDGACNYLARNPVIKECYQPYKVGGGRCYIENLSETGSQTHGIIDNRLITDPRAAEMLLDPKTKPVGNTNDSYSKLFSNYQEALKSQAWLRRLPHLVEDTAKWKGVQAVLTKNGIAEGV